MARVAKRAAIVTTVVAFAVCAAAVSATLQWRRASTTPWGRITAIERADGRSLRVVLETTDAEPSDECPGPPRTARPSSAAGWEYNVAHATVEVLTAERVVLRIEMEHPYSAQWPPAAPDRAEFDRPSTWSRVCLGPSAVGTPVALCCIRFKQLWGGLFWPTGRYFMGASPDLPPALQTQG